MRYVGFVSYVKEYVPRSKRTQRRFTAMTAILLACLFVLGGYAAMWGIIQLVVASTKDISAN
jgi:hypothetical protein